MTSMDLEIIDLTSLMGDMRREVAAIPALRLATPLSPTGKWTRRDSALARLYGPTEWVGDCLLRPYALDTKGYSILRAAGSAWRAHRLAWTIWRGPIPEGMTIDHLCEQPACVLTSHMEVVSLEENSVRRHWRGDVCQNGHDMTDPANVSINGEKRRFRRCRPCWNQYNRESRRAKRDNGNV